LHYCTLYKINLDHFLNNYMCKYKQVRNGDEELRIGYVRGRMDSHNYKRQAKFPESSDVEKIYHEKTTGNIELNAILELFTFRGYCFQYLAG